MLYWPQFGTEERDKIMPRALRMDLWIYVVCHIQYGTVEADTLQLNAVFAGSSTP